MLEPKSSRLLTLSGLASNFVVWFTGPFDFRGRSSRKGAGFKCTQEDGKGEMGKRKRKMGKLIFSKISFQRQWVFRNKKKKNFFLHWYYYISFSRYKSHLKKISIYISTLLRWLIPIDSFKKSETLLKLGTFYTNFNNLAIFLQQTVWDRKLKIGRGAVY